VVTDRHGVVRVAVAADAAAIAELHVRAWQSAYRAQLPQHHLDTLDVEARRQRWLRPLSEPQERWGSVLVVELPGGTLAGFVSVGASRDDDAAADCGEIASLYVEPSLVGRGHGRALTSAALAMLSRNGFRQATVWALSTNTQGRRFYEKAGWTDTGVEKDDEVAGLSIKDVRYHRTLDPTEPDAEPDAAEPDPADARPT
jgi:ribosomal protein S18 acetylase RimI-like enzyme